MNSGVARDTLLDTDVQVLKSVKVVSAMRVFEKVLYAVYAVNSTPIVEKPGLNDSVYIFGIEAGMELTKRGCIGRGCKVRNLLCRFF